MVGLTGHEEERGARRVPEADGRRAVPAERGQRALEEDATGLRRDVGVKGRPRLGLGQDVDEGVSEAGERPADHLAPAQVGGWTIDAWTIGSDRASGGPSSGASSPAIDLNRSTASGRRK